MNKEVKSALFAIRTLSPLNKNGNKVENNIPYLEELLKCNRALLQLFFEDYCSLFLGEDLTQESYLLIQKRLKRVLDMNYKYLDILTDPNN